MIGGTGRPDKRFNIVAVAFGLAALGIFTALYVLQRHIYFAVIDLWSFYPFQYPFLDLVYIPDLVKCWNMGVNVYLENPCDPLGRLHDYSPLWLRLSWLADWVPYTNPIGLTLDVLFMLSLGFLPRPRRRWDYLPLLLAIISPMTAFALERGNVDTLMFLLAMMAVVCMDYALALRMLGYSLIMVASLLKFYPFVLFILLLRERLRVLLLTGLTAFCLMAGLVVVYFNEVRRMFANIPVPSSFTDAFGAAQLPAGLGILAESLLRVGGITGSASGMLPIKVLVSVPITALVILASWAAGRYLAQRDDFRAAANALTRRELLTLVAGAVLVCGCFLSGRSIGYREIIIVLAMPGLSALARTSPAPWLRRLFLWTVWNAVFLMFYAVPQRLIYNTFGNLAQGLPSVPAIVLWFVREICWWWLIAVLVAVLVRFVADSPVWMGFARHPWLVQKNRSNQAKVSSGASSAM